MTLSVPATPDLPFRLVVNAVVADTDGRVLLLRRSPRSSANPGRWELPGGKVDDGEHFDDALRREVREETGLEIALGGPIGVAGQRLSDRTAIHLVMGAASTGDDLQLSDEHDASVWTHPSRFPELDLANWFAEFLERDGHHLEEYLRGH